MKKALVIGLITCSTIFSGCGENAENTIKSEGKKEKVTRTSLYLDKGKSENIEYETKEFDLGDKIYKSSSGKELPYKVRGTVTLPKSDGKKPLAIIVHGSHDNENSNVRFDTGFKYLTEYLGENDYVGIAMDVQEAYVWKYGDNDDNEKIRVMYKEFINSLKKHKELSEKIDFENIVLIGHSRGADTIMDIANENNGIKGILSVAPAISEKERKWPDVKTTIIVPEYDGDVASLDGVPMFNEITNENERKNDGNLIILEKANHNWFNRNLEKNDLELLGDNKKIETQLNREEQEEFLENIAVDFMDNLFKEETEGIFNSNESEPIKMYGLGVKTQSWISGGNDILNCENFNEVEGENLDLKVLNESAFYKNDETKGFNLPMFLNENVEGKKLLNLRWEVEEPVLKIPIDERLEGRESLTINLALDSSDELVFKDNSIKMSLTLKDNEGNETEVILEDEVKALSFVEGKLDYTEIFDYTHYFWDSFTHLSMVRVPISLFMNINLNNLSELKIRFYESNSGAIMIENIRVN